MLFINHLNEKNKKKKKNLLIILYPLCLYLLLVCVLVCLIKLTPYCIMMLVYGLFMTHRLKHLTVLFRKILQTDVSIQRELQLTRIDLLDSFCSVCCYFLQRCSRGRVYTITHYEMILQMQKKQVSCSEHS